MLGYRPSTPMSMRATQGLHREKTSMSQQRISELDGLRGIAASLVLVHHAFPVPLYWGWVGMETFFGLSGYLITTILLRSDITQPLAMRNFLIRRALRIWPVYFCALFGALGIWLLFRHHNPEAFPGVLWWKYFVFLQFTEGYTTQDMSYMEHYVHWFRLSWSLATEEQYYILWPLLILLVRGRRGLMLAFCAAVLLTSIHLRASGYALNLLLTRADGFALGSAMALLQESLPGRSAVFRQRLIAVYTAALLLGLGVILPYILIGYATNAVQQYDDIVRYGNWTVLVIAAALLAFGLIGLLRNDRLPRLQRLLSWRPFTYLGETSYAVYMFQGLVFVVVRNLAKQLGIADSLLLEVVAIVLCLITGQVSKLVIERPMQRFKRYFPVITPTGKKDDVLGKVDTPSKGGPTGDGERFTSAPSLGTRE